MNVAAPLKIAILAHSTNPRGGVVHALELGDALTRAGHMVAVHAPDGRGDGFFRQSQCRTIALPASPVGHDVAEMVEIRVGDYVRYFETPENRAFDVFHAQDGLSGNALADLRARGLIDGFARTVHHVDRFEDPRLEALQRRSIIEADVVFAVSRQGQADIEAAFGRRAVLVGNGVDRHRFSPVPDGSEDSLRQRLGLETGPVLLAVGGVEARKNTLRILEAFRLLRRSHPEARLVIAGGASLLDHHDYRSRFDRALAVSGLSSTDVLLAGPILDADMPGLYRLADVLVFPSVQEGFGLVVIEAMASGLPVVTSRIAPFTEYLGADDVAWCDPLEAGSIAAATIEALDGATRSRLIARGAEVAARHDWHTVATAHLPAYAGLREPHHA